MSSIARKITQFTKKEIGCLFGTARRVFKSPAFVMLMSDRQGDFGRILIVTSRKVGNAPERNKLRRRVKGFFYEENLFNSPFDCAIIFYKKAVSLSFSELKEQVCSVYAKQMARVKDHVASQ